MEVNPQTQHMEITLHVFIDDLQEIIEKSGSPELFLATEKEIPLADSFIHEYIKDNLIVVNEKDTLELSWVGKELSDDLLAFWIYIESDDLFESRGMTIQYSVLQDLYDDQQNILNVIKSNGEEVYFLCRKGDNTASIE